MAGIRTAIELQDNFTSILYQVIDSVNLGLSAMEDLHQTMSSPVDMASIDGARAAIDRAAIAVRELDAAIQGTDSPEIDPPPSPPPIDIPVNPVLPNPVIDQPPPVDVSVQWQSDSLEVFAGSGMGRFRQEVQSTNNTLDTLSQTQGRIMQVAADMDFLPPDGLTDLFNMQNRLQAIQQRIQAMESNPLNMGTDAANAELETLRGQLDQAVQEQQMLNRAVDSMDVQAANDAYARLSQTIGGAERHIRDNVDEQGRLNREIRQGTQEANELMRVISGVVAAYATVQTFSSVLNLSDTLTSTTARLNMMNDGLQTTQDLQNLIYLSAERARGSYQATADAVSKLGLMAGDAFGSSEEIIAFMEQVNKQFRIAGTEAAGIDAAMLQLTQAMGSGVLRGEEYNSILEQAPNIIQNIAGYIEGNEEVLASVADAMGMKVEELAGNVQGNLKDIAGEGLLSAELIKSAMFAAADETNAKFESMPMTFEQIWTSFENTALMAFQPVLEQINEIANSELFQGFVDNATQGLIVLSGITQYTIALLVNGASWIADNWSWIAPVILGVAGALAVYYGWQMLCVGVTTAMAEAQDFLNAVMSANPILLIVMAIIVLVAALYAAIAAINKFAGTSISATGIIMAAFFVMKAFIYNTVLVPLQHSFAQCANFVGNVFNDPVAAVKVAFYDMCLTVIGYIQNLASAIETLLNKIPGVTVDITSGLDNFYAGLEQAQQAVKDESGWVEYVERWEFEDYNDARDAGYRFGQGIESSIRDFDPSSFFGDSIPNPDDYIDPGGYGGGVSGIGDSLGRIGSGVGDIAGNTGRMADSMEVTEEELKYLRDIAEQEAINRFTTAEITIEQTNNNAISSGMDLDKIVSGLDDALGEAIEIMTEGVHV